MIFNIIYINVRFYLITSPIRKCMAHLFFFLENYMTHLTPSICEKKKIAHTSTIMFKFKGK